MRLLPILIPYSAEGHRENFRALFWLSSIFWIDLASSSALGLLDLATIRDHDGLASRSAAAADSLDGFYD